MEDPPISEVFDRLDADKKISGTVEELVLGALLGRLTDVIDGVDVKRPEKVAGATPRPVQAYLKSVAVTGFRGVGPTSELRFRPQPGLTLVVGRNGSGKSSFAEAAEYAFTGDSRRWSGKSLDWKKGWRNLHTDDDPGIEVKLRIDGQKKPFHMQDHKLERGVIRRTRGRGEANPGTCEEVISR